MSKRDDLAAKYTKDMDAKVSIQADQDKMLGIIKACGPAIYRSDAETVSAGDPEELNRIKNGFMKKHLNLEGEEAEKVLDRAIERYGRSNTSKYRAVLYYIMADETGNLGKF